MVIFVNVLLCEAVCCILRVSISVSVSAGGDGSVDTFVSNSYFKTLWNCDKWFETGNDFSIIKVLQRRQN